MHEITDDSGPSPEISADELAGEHDDGFESEFRARYPLIWSMTLVGPFVLTAVLYALLATAFGADYANRLGARAVWAFFVFGKFAILAPSKVLTPEQLFLLIFYMDMMTAALLTFHLGFLFKLPFLGPRLKELVRDGEFILASNPWMKRVTFLGIIAFVTFPLAATGSVGGSIFGRLLGMSRLSTFVGIAIGSLLGCGMMYFGAEFIRDNVSQDNPLLTIGGIAVVLAIIFLMNRRYRKMKDEHFAIKDLNAKREAKRKAKRRHSA